MWFSTAKDVLKINVAEAIKPAAEEYQKDFWVFNCTIDWTPVSLWGLMYGLSINEWGFKDWTVGRKTNNRWSLHRKQWLKPISGTIYADWVNTRPVYYSVQDGLYEKAYLITRDFYSHCNFKFNHLYSYIKWWRTPRTASNVEYVQDRLDQLKREAIRYDQRQPLYNPPLDTGVDEPVKTHKKECTWIANVDTNQTVQYDNWLGQFLSIFTPKEKTKIFICNN